VREVAGYIIVAIMIACALAALVRWRNGRRRPPISRQRLDITRD
jgi:hypothetical protein